MTQPSTTPQNREKRRRALLVPFAILALATSGVAALTTGAFFTDSQSVTGNTFTTGTVKLSATPATAAITMSGMAPGDVKVGSITVANTGSLAERYSMLSTATNADSKNLASALVTTVKTGVTTCTEAGFAATGTVVYGPGVFGSAAGTKILGDAAQGQQTGDRTLAASASEVLCMQVSLPTTATNGVQDATTSATFKFDSEQVVNNP